MRALALLAVAACRFGFEPTAGDGGTGDTLGDSGAGGRARIAAGIEHTCLIRGTTLYCFGANAEGQLGLGDTMPRSLPVALAGAWIDVAAGGGHTCAIDMVGKLFCWGGNMNSELGVGDTAIRMTPTPVTLPAVVREIDATDVHTCAILDDGSLMAWGENAEGQLGQNDPANSPDIPTPTLMSTMKNWTAIGCGYAHTLASQAGALFGTGRNTSFQLGLGDAAQTQYRSLQPVDSGPWSVLAGGQNHSCGIKNNAVYCWGENQSMEVGTGDNTPQSTPTPITSAGDWLDVEVDTFGGCALAQSGEAYCWGRNVEGQLGTDDQMDRYVPTRTGSNWRSISVGRFHACGERRDGTFWCAGKNDFGQLGMPPSLNVPSWTQVMLPST